MLEAQCQMRRENEHSLAVNPNVATYVEEKRARVHSRRGGTAHRLGQVEAYLTYLESCPRRAQPQMACNSASAAVFAGEGMQY
jgi:hypothetical protein